MNGERSHLKKTFKSADLICPVLLVSEDMGEWDCFSQCGLEYLVYQSSKSQGLFVDHKQIIEHAVILSFLL